MDKLAAIKVTGAPTDFVSRTGSNNQGAISLFNASGESVT